MFTLRAMSVEQLGGHLAERTTGASSAACRAHTTCVVGDMNLRL